MSDVTIKWTQRVAGRHVGDVETVERTAFIDAVLRAGRAVEHDEEPEPAEKPKKKTAPKKKATAAKPAPILGVFDNAAHEKMTDDGAPGTE